MFKCEILAPFCSRFIKSGVVNSHNILANISKIIFIVHMLLTVD